MVQIHVIEYKQGILYRVGYPIPYPATDTVRQDKKQLKLIVDMKSPLLVGTAYAVFGKNRRRKSFPVFAVLIQTV
jgi:hypothetical protein